MGLAKDVDELPLDDRDHLLRAGQASQDLGAGRLLADAIDELADDLEVDVGFEQGDADLSQGFVEVFFVDNAAAAETAKYGLELIGKEFKHEATDSF